MWDPEATMWDATMLAGAASTWAVTSPIEDVASSTQTVTVSMWAVSDTSWDSHPLCGLLHPVRALSLP